MIGYEVTDEKLLEPFKSFIEGFKKMKEEQQQDEKETEDLNKQG